MRERRFQPAMSIDCLGEIDFAERAPLQQFECERIDLWAYGLDEIQRQRLASLGIIVDDAKPWVEADRLTSEHSLRFSDGIEVRQDRIHERIPWRRSKPERIKQRCDDSRTYRYAVTTSTWVFDGNGFSCNVPSCTVHSGVERSGTVAPTSPPQS